MDQAEALAIPGSTWEAEFLEDTSPRRVVLEHYEREQLALRRYLSFLGLDAETGQDVVQESFLKLFQHLLAGGDRTNLRAWLYRVAHNVARNIQTAHRATKTSPLADGGNGIELPANTMSIEEELATEQRIARIRHGIAKLSPAQKSCLVLRAQGLKYREIADVLNLSVSTVGENVQRGLEQLKELV